MLYLKKNTPYTNALVIGDRKIDVQAGQAAGFDTVLVDGSKVFDSNHKMKVN